LEHVTAQEHLKAAARELLVPAAREHGYVGAFPTWRKRSAEDDWAIVNLQSSPRSTAAELRCVLNVAVAPQIWIRWLEAIPGARSQRQPSESSGLYRTRIHPRDADPGRDAWWTVADANSARSAVTEMSEQMSEKGWALLETLLDREAMLSQIRVAGDLGDMKRVSQPIVFKRAEAALLLELGRRDELAGVLADLRTLAAQGGLPAAAKRFEDWILGQSEVLGPEGESKRHGGVVR
jgi:hypothetical protein